MEIVQDEFDYIGFVQKISLTQRLLWYEIGSSNNVSVLMFFLV